MNNECRTYVFEPRQERFVKGKLIQIIFDENLTKILQTKKKVTEHAPLNNCQWFAQNILTPHRFIEPSPEQLPEEVITKHLLTRPLTSPTPGPIQSWEGLRLRWCSISGPTSSSSSGQTTTIIVKVTTPAWSAKFPKDLPAIPSERAVKLPPEGKYLEKDVTSRRDASSSLGDAGLARTERWFVIPDGNRSKVTPRHDEWGGHIATSNDSRDIKNSLECDKWHETWRGWQPGVVECMFWEIRSLKYVRQS